MDIPTWVIAIVLGAHWLLIGFLVMRLDELQFKIKEMIIDHVIERTKWWPLIYQSYQQGAQGYIPPRGPMGSDPHGL